MPVVVRLKGREGKYKVYRRLPRADSDGEDVPE